MKVTVVGGGSTYTPELADGIARLHELLPVDELALTDPDTERLALVAGPAPDSLGDVEHHRHGAQRLRQPPGARRLLTDATALERQCLVDRAGSLPADPQLEQHDRGAVERLVEVGRPDQAAGMPLLGQDPLGDSADQVQPLLVRVGEHELLDRQQVAQAGEPVHQLRRVRRPAADDCDLHPLTPVRVTPSTKAFCAKKNRTITGSITSTVAAITRFHCTWCSARNEASPTATVQWLGSSLV